MERERAKRGHTAPAQITAINVEADPRQTRLGRGEWDWHAGGGTGDQQFKYDDPVGEHGSISVDLKQNAGGWRLTVSDQGRGLPDNFDIDQRKRFGMQVVKAFVRRLDATMTVSSRPGHTAFEVTNGVG